MNSSCKALQALSRAVDTHSQNGFTAIVLFNPHTHPRRDRVEVALNIPETITTFELLDADQTVIPHEFIGSSNNELANLLLKKNELRDTIGAISEGRVAGVAITSVKVTRQGATDATLWLVADGLVALEERAADGSTHTTRLLGYGEGIGQRGVFGGLPRGTTAVTVDPTTLLYAEGEALLRPRGHGGLIRK